MSYTAVFYCADFTLLFAQCSLVGCHFFLYSGFELINVFRFMNVYLKLEINSLKENSCILSDLENILAMEHSLLWESHGLETSLEWFCRTTPRSENGVEWYFWIHNTQLLEVSYLLLPEVSVAPVPFLQTSIFHGLSNIFVPCKRDCASFLSSCRVSFQSMLQPSVIWHASYMCIPLKCSILKCFMIEHVIFIIFHIISLC